MRVEINLTLFFEGKREEQVDGFLSVSDAADEDELMDAMGHFIEDAANKHSFSFTSGLAHMIVGDDVYHITFQNPELQVEGTELCNIIIPEGLTIH
jgi:glutamyl-tRNA reductase